MNISISDFCRKMSICPICSTAMLRHYSQGRRYYFCARCRQEMPCSLEQKIYLSGKQTDLPKSSVDPLTQESSWLIRG